MHAASGCKPLLLPSTATLNTHTTTSLLPEAVCAFAEEGVCCGGVVCVLLVPGWRLLQRCVICGQHGGPSHLCIQQWCQSCGACIHRLHHNLWQPSLAHANVRGPGHKQQHTDTHRQGARNAVREAAAVGWDQWEPPVWRTLTQGGGTLTQARMFVCWLSLEPSHTAHTL